MNWALGVFFKLAMRSPWRNFNQGQRKPLQAQRQALRRIIVANQNTEFGRRHNFPALAKVSDGRLWRDFRTSVPIRSYADFQSDIEAMKDGKKNVLVPGLPSMFSLTSGTTAEPKFCPITPAFIREHHRSHLLWMYRVFLDHPQLNSGKYLVLTSPANLGLTKGGIPYGCMSGKQLADQSIPVRRRLAVPPAVQEISDSEGRWLNTLLFALAHKDLSLVLAVNPSSLLAVASRLREKAEELIEHLSRRELFPTLTPRLDKALARRFHPTDERAKELREIFQADGTLLPAAIWPKLQLISTWQGGASSFYLPHVSAAWGGVPQRCLGLRASEGTFSIPLRDNTSSAPLAVCGHAMEFVPAEVENLEANTPTLLANDLEQGKSYRMVVTTSGGFYRYDLGDVVEVTRFNRSTPEISFIRRAGANLSVSGEKVTEDQLVEAMQRAGEKGVLLNGFTVTWEMENSVTRYVLAVEYAGGTDRFFQRQTLMREQFQEMLNRFDQALQEVNCEYAAKRRDGRLSDPRLVLLADGSYRDYYASQGKEGRPENQVKPPHIVHPATPGRVPVPGTRFFDLAKIEAEI
ncbi:MAG: GH3 auxin-responsive promoter family protein [Planctomycetota bacterium]|jgi:phenylacetate-coenzyme A ligase PaaK-like adenylate-forming protein|nr:GH3 auxin-responsive promoter family protein [Planctomycetota bacterium]